MLPLPAPRQHKFFQPRPGKAIGSFAVNPPALFTLSLEGSKSEASVARHLLYSLLLCALCDSAPSM